MISEFDLSPIGLEDASPLTLALIFGALLGLAFGALAQRTQFCLRRGLAGAPIERQPALGVWAAALATAILATSALAAYGALNFTEHRFHAAEVPLFAIVLGGLLFGAGMVLTRGCTSRLAVLAGSGNLRAWVSLIIFAVAAHATLKGALAPARVWISEPSVDLGAYATLAALPGGAPIWGTVIAVALAAFAARSGASVWHLGYAVMIGGLVALGWFGTGVFLADEFDPIPFESLAFTSSATEALFWTVAGTAITPGFGVGLIGGVLAGAFLAAYASGELRVERFDAGTPVEKYIGGSVLMGIGGVLAGGCTIGAGLTGVSTLSISAIIALASIAAGAVAANTFAAQSGQRVMLPAE